MLACAAHRHITQTGGWEDRPEGLYYVLLAQHVMNERDRNRALANGRGDALDAARADIADGEDAGPARLEQQRRARQWPAGGSEIVVREIGAGLDETVLVEREASIEPVGVRHGARHHEDVSDLMLLLGAGLRVAPAHRLKRAVTLERDDLRIDVERDRRRLFDPSREISRHRLGEPA